MCLARWMAADRQGKAPAPSPPVSAELLVRRIDALNRLLPLTGGLDRDVLIGIIREYQARAGLDGFG